MCLTGGVELTRIDSRPLTNTVDKVRKLNDLCKAGRIFDAQEWIADQKRPLQLADHVKIHHTYRSALGIAISSGQYSLVELLLQHGYQPNLDHACPITLAVEHKRQDIAERLIACRRPQTQRLATAEDL